MSANLVLAIDTSGPNLQLALCADNPDFSPKTHVEAINRGHAEILFGRIEHFLSENSCAYQDLSRIAVSTGPGSFTGLRIGISAARGLALALEVEVIGVPNLLAISLGSKFTEFPSEFAVIIDAKRHHNYAQKFFGPGRPVNDARILEAGEATNKYISSTSLVISDPKLGIALLAQFAAKADVKLFPPVPAYLRAADAKPQTKKRIARQ